MTPTFAGTAIQLRLSRLYCQLPPPGALVKLVIAIPLRCANRVVDTPDCKDERIIRATDEPAGLVLLVAISVNCSASGIGPFAVFASLS